MRKGIRSLCGVVHDRMGCSVKNGDVFIFIGSNHGYTFTYDGANRLLDAVHGSNHYTEKVTSYDKNGNIKGLQRYGQTGASTYGLVDNLTYTLNGNQITKVEDASTAVSYNGGTNFVNGASIENEYTYDYNGNLTKDSNKGIADIWNSLNFLYKSRPRCSSLYSRVPIIEDFSHKNSIGQSFPLDILIQFPFRTCCSTQAFLST